jgi:hypothetical protein
MCEEVSNRHVDSPVVTAVVYTAWGLPLLGWIARGPWGAVAGAAAVGIIATSTPKWTKSNLFEKIEQRWIGRWTKREAKRYAREEQERLERIRSYQKRVANPGILSRGSSLVSPWLFAISFWLCPAATPLNQPYQGAFISVSWIGMIVAVLWFPAADYAEDMLKAELENRRDPPKIEMWAPRGNAERGHEPEIKKIEICTLKEIAHCLETWSQRYPVFIGCSVLAAIAALFIA